MRKIQQFDPSLSTTGTIHTYGMNKKEQLIFYNDSPEFMELTFSDNSVIPIPAGWVKDIILINIAMGDIQWTVTSTLNVSAYPCSLCYGEIREEGEHVDSVNQPIPRAMNVNAPGGLIVTTQTLFNNGNLAHTEIVSVGVLNEGTATWIAFNDGTMSIFLRTAANTYVQAFNLQLSEPYAEVGVQGHDLQLWGHLINRDASSDVPTFTNINANVANLTLIAGADDSRGIITFDVINAPIAAATNLFTVNFGRAFTTYTPAIVLCNATNQGLSQYHYASAGLTAFTVENDASLAVATSYKVAYLVMG